MSVENVARPQAWNCKRPGIDYLRAGEQPPAREQGYPNKVSAARTGNVRITNAVADASASRIMRSLSR